MREQNDAVGHAVRALYLYSGMADAAMETGDKALENACKKLFEDIYERKMYITGGVGSTRLGESLTIPYDLPNDTAYAETCASIALVFFAKLVATDLKKSFNYHYLKVLIQKEL